MSATDINTFILQVPSVLDYLKKNKSTDQTYTQILTFLMDTEHTHSKNCVECLTHCAQLVSDENKKREGTKINWADVYDDDDANTVKNCEKTIAQRIQSDKKPSEIIQYDKKPSERFQYDKKPSERFQYDKKPSEIIQSDKKPSDDESWISISRKKGKVYKTNQIASPVKQSKEVFLSQEDVDETKTETEDAKSKFQLWTCHYWLGQKLNPRAIECKNKDSCQFLHSVDDNGYPIGEGWVKHIAIDGIEFRLSSYNNVIAFYPTKGAPRVIRSRNNQF
jgi:hypothetical protein